MPNRPRSHELEDVSRNRLHGAFEYKGWTVEDLAKDYGEDLLVRIFDSGSATPYSFFVQAKATDNLDRYLDKTGGQLRFPLDTDHLKHWKQFWEPVILTLWDSQSDITYWECVQNALEKEKGGSRTLLRPKSARLMIPRENVLDDRGLRRIDGITRTRYKRLCREEEGAKVLISLLKKELGMEIEYWPQSGLLTIKLPGKKMKTIIFGKLAAGYGKIAKSLNLSPQETFVASIDLAKQVFGAYVDGRHIGIIDAMTGEIKQQWRTLDELIRYIEAQAEIHDADEPE